MTTLAYKDGVIAYDSRATQGSLIVDDDISKRVTCNGVEFFFCGNPAQIPELIDAYFQPEVSVPSNANIGAFAYDTQAKTLTTIGADGEVIHKLDVRKDTHYAMGSGMEFALAAMDLGLSAKDAVKAAAKRDAMTGGKIKVYKLK